MVKETSARAKAAAASADDEILNEWRDGKYVHALSSPIMAEGNEVTRLTLREPTTLDVIEAGNPCTFDPAHNPPRVVFDEKKLAAMISRLAAIPPSSVGKMKPKDFAALGWILADFFLPV